MILPVKTNISCSTLIRMATTIHPGVAGNLAMDESPMDESPTDDAPTDDAPTDDAPMDESPTDDSATLLRYCRASLRAFQNVLRQIFKKVSTRGRSVISRQLVLVLLDPPPQS